MTASKRKTFASECCALKLCVRWGTLELITLRITWNDLGFLPSRRFVAVTPPCASTSGRACERRPRFSASEVATPPTLTARRRAYSTTTRSECVGRACPFMARRTNQVVQCFLLRTVNRMKSTEKINPLSQIKSGFFSSTGVSCSGQTCNDGAAEMATSKAAERGEKNWSSFRDGGVFLRTI